MESFVLSCNRVIGQHISENLMLWYDEIVVLVRRLNMLLQTVPLIISKAFPGYEVESDFASNEEEEEEDNDTDDTDECIANENLLLEHHSCFGHSAGGE